MTEKHEMDASVVQDLLEQAVTLSQDYGEEVAAAVRAAVDTPLDANRARKLYTRLLGILRGVDSGGLSEAQRRELAEAVRREVDGLVAAVTRPRAGLKMVEKFGLAPRKVRPIPVFNGLPVEMDEGYVDVETLQLWSGNHRIELHVAEFRERNNGREPDPHELIDIMQGSLHLPSLGADDPFNLGPLARSISRKGVERAPIVTHDGIPKDGNRRIAASLLVLHSKEFTPEEKERARWIRVWRAPEETTEDQFEAIVVSLNFEDDYKEDWPEYVKARLVVGRFDELVEMSKARGEVAIRDIKRQVAKQFVITVSEVTRYIKMVRWAEDFEDYHVNEARRDPADVRYRANDIFQWFYEIDAGRGQEKLTAKLDADDDLKPVVYDLMFDVMDSGAQVRTLHKVVADTDALEMLVKAHDVSDTNKKEALRLVNAAIEEGKRKSPSRQSIGLEQFLKTAVARLGATAPDQWAKLDTDLLRDVRRVFVSSVGAIDGVLGAREPEREETAA